MTATIDRPVPRPGILDIAAHTQGDVVNPALMGCNDFGQGGLIPLLGPLQEG